MGPHRLIHLCQHWVDSDFNFLCHPGRLSGVSLWFYAGFPRQQMSWAFLVHLSLGCPGHLNISEMLFPFPLQSVSCLLPSCQFNGALRRFPLLNIMFIICFPFYYGLLQDIEYSFLCCTIGPCCSSTLYVIVYSYLLFLNALTGRLFI